MVEIVDEEDEVDADDEEVVVAELKYSVQILLIFFHR